MANDAVTNSSEAAAVAALVKDNVKPFTIPVEGGSLDAEVLLVPKGFDVKSVKPFVDEYRTAPERRKGTARFTELESFIAHVVRFKDEDSVIFADRNPDAPTMTAVLDYNRMADGPPRFGQHRSVYEFPLSDEWKAWIEGAATPMDQGKFAAFLEDRIADVLDPVGALETAKAVMERLLTTFASPAKLIDLARGLTVRVESNVANQQNLQSGVSVLRFDTTHTDERGAPLEVPGAFLIGVPVFRGGERYQLAARLRYRVKEHRITWWFELYRAEETFDHAFSEACRVASEKTTLPLFMGTPES